MAYQVFKPYHQNQLRLLPLDLDEMIGEDHMVRVVDEVIDALDPSILYGLYKGGGTSAYNPVMMLKVIIYAYSSGIYSSRKIEAATKENIHFMWLSGLTPLDHMTINRFRSERIKDVFEQIFASIVEALAGQGHLSLETYFLDGTKIEASAGKYTFVWAKSNDRYHENLKEKIRTHLEMIDRLNEAEDELFGDKKPGEISSEEIRDIADKINEKLRKQQKERAEKEQLENEKAKPTEMERELKRTKRTIEKEWLPKMERYEKNKDILGTRGSFSKTDSDATFMRMKDDHMKNGQLKAAYNIQAGCEGQFITGYTVHQNPGDTSCMIAHLKKQKELMGRLPGTLVADAAYGSEENYVFLEENEIRPFVKFNWFFKEQQPKTKNDPFYVGNWPYHQATDSYLCPQGCLLEFVSESKSETSTGYEYLERTYRCQSCEGCTDKAKCMKSTDPGRNRLIKVRPKMVEYRSKATALLTSEEGVEFRKKRGIEIESVFGNIKQNLGFRRFTLRGLDKVTLEWGLIAVAHNMRKLTAAIKEKTKESQSLLAAGSRTSLFRLPA